MGSSNSRHAPLAPERRDRADYPVASREEGSVSSRGSDLADALSRITESQLRGSNGRERFRSRLRTGRSSSTSDVETSTPGLDPLTPRNISGRELGAAKGNCRSVEDSIPVPCSGADRYVTSWTATEGSSSSTVSFPDLNAQNPDSVRNVDTGRSSVGLVMEIRPSVIVSPGISSVDGAEARPAQSIAPSDSRNLWLEGHPPWIARLGSSEASRLDGISSVGLSLSSLQNLQAFCETSVQHHRVNEMQERLRRYAGLPPSLDVHDLERRGILSAESSTVESHIVGDGRSSMSGGERDGFPFQSRPASLQAWEITEEGRLIEYRHSVYSESWERHVAFHRSELHSAIANRSSRPPVSSASPLSAGGRESRRNGGRRLWDTITRAASHRRATPMTTPLTESGVNSWGENDSDLMDFQAFHSRSLELEERRRRVRSQVWALQLLSNGLGGMPGFSRPCTSGRHHSHCFCGLHSSTEESSTRASISRIIMLAEALFEVLDEIHRQSLALSRASAPVTSLPAPDDVVDAIPIRKFTKKLWEEATRCNICLVEYEDGDQVKVLPCHHEYHVACVDKWLKEIHRICPLCRSNVCELSSMVRLPLSI